MISSESQSASNIIPLYAFAGIDGAGKTTLINGISSELRIGGQSVHVSKAYGHEQKESFKSFIETADDVEIMFMFQAFQRRRRNTALAKLALGDIVLADRWNESYDAFHSQNGALSADPTLRKAIDNLTIENLKPHRTFYLRTKASVAMRRTHERGADFFDAKAIGYHQRQAHYYDERAEQDVSWITLDGHLREEELVEAAMDTIDNTL